MVVSNRERDMIKAIGKFKTYLESIKNQKIDNIVIKKYDLVFKDFLQVSVVWKCSLCGVKFDEQNIIEFKTCPISNCSGRVVRTIESLVVEKKW